MQTKLIALLAVGALTLASCGAGTDPLEASDPGVDTAETNQPNTTSENAQRGITGNWRLTSLLVDGETVELPSVNMTLSVEESGSFEGDDGCNSFWGTLDVPAEGPGGDFALPEELPSTDTECPDDLADFNVAY